ncbi:ABC transporter substrate-binding protein [Bacillus niameyensis]|uniref:ABC transporter substrate-binding protein n=1 Tax=Bacillus niameyensis TaxID=1522308 RepID=UPI000786447F|nr:ABC transporter substrate-binding protein [Bacillus niameyensis]
MLKQKWWMLGLIILLCSLLVACNSKESNQKDTGNEKGEDQEQAEGPEEVTLKFAYGWGEEAFIEHYKDPVEKALPHIKLEWVEANIGLAEQVEELLSKGIVPDMWVGSGAAQLRIMQQYEMDWGLDELFEKNNYDWSRVNPKIEQFVRNQVRDKQMYMVPLYQGADSLYYNKDIFDIFGVEYPKDHMTWNEVRDLAAKVTGEKNGKMYRGFDINSPQMMLDQRQVTHIDPETNEVLFVKEPIYAEYVSYLESLWSIPGMLPEEDPGDYLYRWGANFFSDHDVAMTIAWDRFPNAKAYEEQGLNWDMVTMPVWDDQPNMITPPDAYYVFPSRTTEHQDAVYEVLEYFLSDEYQEWASRNLGRTTVLDNPEIQETIASEIEGLEDKNLQSIFIMERNPGLPIEEVSEYAGLQYNALYRGVQEFASLDTDVNTFLRIMTEKTEENIRKAQETE